MNPFPWKIHEQPVDQELGWPTQPKVRQLLGGGDSGLLNLPTPFLPLELSNKNQR